MVNNRKPRVPLRVILVSFFVASILNILHYPDWMVYARPDWVLLVLFYWCIALPERISVGSGWLAGIFLDILYYAVLGQNAAAKALVALIAVSAHRRIRLYDMWQQCVIVFLVASVDLAITTWIYHLTTGSPITIVTWQSALTSSLLWPIVYTILRQVRIRSN